MFSCSGPNKSKLLAPKHIPTQIKLELTRASCREVMSLNFLSQLYRNRKSSNCCQGNHKSDSVLPWRQDELQIMGWQKFYNQSYVWEEADPSSSSETWRHSKQQQDVVCKRQNSDKIRLKLRVFPSTTLFWTIKTFRQNAHNRYRSLPDW